jgi:dUTP pyrophosphatase
MDLKNEEKYIKVVVVEEKAVFPTKAHPSDIGYDLTAISVYKNISKNIILFETGIKVSPPEGYYIEILPRSSISKTGYMLANSVGIIDPSYTGTLKIALIKVDESLPDIDLPFTKCQLVVRKVEYSFIMEQVNSIKDTVRGCGGFGSSDKK